MVGSGTALGRRKLLGSDSGAPKLLELEATPPTEGSWNCLTPLRISNALECRARSTLVDAQDSTLPHSRDAGSGFVSS